MPTHTAGCSGCDCAKVEVKLTSPDEMEFTFWQSPPVVHVHLTLVRKGKEPKMRVIESTMFSPYKKCQMVPHYGPNLPGEPNLTNSTASWPRAVGFDAALAPPPRIDDPKVAALAGLPRGCARGLLGIAKENAKLGAMLDERTAALEKARGGGDVSGPEFGKRKCHRLNGFNHLLNEVQTIPAHRTVVPDIRLQYIKPKLPCKPCDVSYSVSAKIDEDEYIALGFKGQSWEHMFPYPPEYGRPCYFGMCVDAYDNFTTDRIALGYASSSHGSCVREVGLNGTLLGKPTDVQHKMHKGTSVERTKGRTIVRFTVPQYWPDYKASIMPDGPFRTMWAIGKLAGDGTGCDADFGYHGLNKGVSPVDWLLILGSMPCVFSDEEMGSV